MNNKNEGGQKLKRRSLYENFHKINQTSLLSHNSLEIDMKGFLNLLIIIICTTHFRLILENFKKYGLIIKIPKNCDILKNLPLLFCFISLHVTIFFSWFIERYVTSWLYTCVDEDKEHTSKLIPMDDFNNKTNMIKENKNDKTIYSNLINRKNKNNNGNSVLKNTYSIYSCDSNTTYENETYDKFDKDNSTYDKCDKDILCDKNFSQQTCNDTYKKKQKGLTNDTIERTKKNENIENIDNNDDIHHIDSIDTCVDNNNIVTRFNDNNIITSSYIKKKKKKLHGWKNFHLSIFILKCINSIFILLFPLITISHYDTEPTLSSILLTISIVWFFKFYSFHEVCYEARKLHIENPELKNIIDDDPYSEIYYIKRYPYCLTLKSYYTYILMPTMCFQFFYPRTDKIRWINVAKHIVEVILLIIMIKIISDQYMFITVENTFTMKEFTSAHFSVKITHIIERMLKVSIPTLYIWLIGFLIVFHHWCNILAEITRFGDRLFYKDWWNASSFAEYWRKWNLPIYYFVCRHINKPLIYYGIHRNVSMIIVFFISAMLHEYLISIPLKLGFTGYIFFAFICQIPLVQFTNNAYFKKHKTIGNSIFWIVFCFTGQPLILFIYYYLWIDKQGILKN
ncbi:diacylglycerol O-acyltransferase [Plasmodium sp. gorilla clade G2]|uniref:diacylglycerol O-acyltransferase n=1 Tax=Plasmodium sp. gorilla clade G2 TaxID=880535 RepID=UPI000D201F7E|nr:diacylglycerol O-acyltransferase [Plasmodium sp. gorilla clade G2]SOV11052.1 diacylglycerol O-acyltransferase [Plasmodium sp. gorilla clade G2]